MFLHYGCQLVSCIIASSYKLTLKIIYLAVPCVSIDHWRPNCQKTTACFTSIFFFAVVFCFQKEWKELKVLFSDFVKRSALKCKILVILYWFAGKYIITNNTKEELQGLVYFGRTSCTVWLTIGSEHGFFAINMTLHNSSISE